MKFFIGLLLFLSNVALADNDLFLRYSLNAKGKLSDIKSLAIGLQRDHGRLQTKYETGLIINHEEPMWFGQAGVGLEPRAGAFYVHFFQSIGVVSIENRNLSGYFQFVEDFGLGIKDEKTGTAIGLSFKHISNAGLSKPNKGLDMIGLQVRIPIN